jgi:hypothetical protein
MVIKYYGSSKVQEYVGWTASHPVINNLYVRDPYKRPGSGPSWSVWIVPGTVDIDGNDVTYGANSNR